MKDAWKSVQSAACVACAACVLVTAYVANNHPNAPPAPSPVQGGNVAAPAIPTVSPNTVEVWLTTGDLSVRLQQQSALTLGYSAPTNQKAIVVNSGTRYQTVFGIGSALPDSSAYLMHATLPATLQQSLLSALFDPSDGIKLELMRVPMGASDFSHVGDYSYDDNAGVADPTLQHFSIEHDTTDVLPVLQAAMGFNPNLKVLTTPWSPPGWMKKNATMDGSNTNNVLSLGIMPTYAQYFLDFVNAYEAAGIPIWAVTPQNEPQYFTPGYPCMNFLAQDEATFIDAYLGPLFAKAASNTKIIGFDHNYCDDSNCPNPYPIRLAQRFQGTSPNYLYGIAWHCYAGDANAMGTFHAAYPDLPLFLTECSSGAWESTDNDPVDYYNGALSLVIDTLQNGSTATFLWPVALDPNSGPTNHGCSNCRGMVTVDSNAHAYTLNPEFYALGHASKFIWPNATRIAATGDQAGLRAVAVENTDASLMLLVHNTTSALVPVHVVSGARAFDYAVPSGATVTFRWAP